MTASRPPRLATALLRRAFDDDDPVVGDLFEGFARTRSRLWFWRQTLSALAFRSRQPRDHTHPLGLAPRADALRAVDPVRHVGPRSINLSASPLPHAGGLGLVVFVTLIAVVSPQAGWMVVPIVAGGVVIAIAMVLVRRRHQRS